jgi:DNA mismatch repair ATPase MutL
VVKYRSSQLSLSQLSLLEYGKEVPTDAVVIGVRLGPHRSEETAAYGKVQEQVAHLHRRAGRMSRRRRLDDLSGEDLAKALACKGSTRFDENLSSEEMEVLLREWSATEFRDTNARSSQNSHSWLPCLADRGR